jgi:hypothetical protein
LDPFKTKVTEDFEKYESDYSKKKHDYNYEKKSYGTHGYKTYDSKDYEYKPSDSVYDYKDSYSKETITKEIHDDKDFSEKKV